MTSKFEAYLNAREQEQDLSFLKPKDKAQDTREPHAAEVQISQKEGEDQDRRSQQGESMHEMRPGNAAAVSTQIEPHKQVSTQEFSSTQNLGKKTVQETNENPAVHDRSQTSFWATERDLAALNLCQKNVSQTQQKIDENYTKTYLKQYENEGYSGINSQKLPPLRWSTRLKIAFERVLSFWKTKEARRVLSTVADQKVEKSKQTRTLLLVGAVGVGLVVAFVLLGGVNKKQKAPEVKIYESDFRVAPESIDKQSFQFQYEERLEMMNAKLKGYEATVEQLSQRIKALDKEKAKRESKDSTSTQSVSLSDMPEFSPESSGVRPESFLPKSSQVPAPSKSLGVVKVYDANSRLEGSDAITQIANKGTGSAGSILPSRNVRHFRAESPIAANRARHEAENTYLPAGSFAQAVVLSGVTAATGGNAANNPVPLLLEIKDMARLPNRFRANVKRCFVTGSATGDLSSERVWIRLDRLSCMSKTGKAVDVKVQGYATGEDGKTGVRARLVTRSGQAIASAVFTGLLSGMGKAASMSASSSVTYSSGATGTTVNDSLRAGIGQGMQDAMDRIVDYYLRLADKIFPVLELDSGRKVDIVLSQGLTIAFNDSDAKAKDAGEVNSAANFGLSIRNEP